ncbi:MAG TPA: SpoIIE family protein phosphatase [Clostridiaceae bacterium]|nr:SpoIIE family protein phosphatase [Clostridiaceae bacterium]
MGSNKKSSRVFIDKFPYVLPVAVTIFSILLFKFAYLFEDNFYRIMDVATYLTWHNIFEFTGILVCFAVFVVSYFTYEQTQNLRRVFLGCVFLAVGMVEMFHTLSFKGMPDFFVPNKCANRATTFWILSRILLALGLLISECIPAEKKSVINRRVFMLPAVALSLLILVVATYFPHLLPPMYIEGKGLTQTKIVLEYVVIFLLIASTVLLIREYKKNRDSLQILFCSALILIIFSELAFVSYFLVYDIYNYLGHIYKFISYFIIFKVIFVENVQKPYIELKEAQDELRDYADNLDKIVEQRTGELKQVNRRLLEDLEYARDIQLAMLPSRLPEIREVSFTARYFPAEHVGGDFYDIFRIDNENIGLYIGDVSGHGVPAAMLTVFAKQSIKSVNENCTGKKELLNPSLVLGRVYESFNNTNFKDEVYIVLLFGIYNIKKKEFTYSSAGINASPFVIRSSGEIDELAVTGFPICKFRDYYYAVYEDRSIKLNPGDRVLFYTDGMIEAENKQRVSFSEKRLKEILKQNRDLDGLKLSEAIERHIFEFVDPDKLKDDITFFIMDIKQ